MCGRYVGKWGRVIWVGWGAGHRQAEGIWSYGGRAGKGSGRVGVVGGR